MALIKYSGHGAATHFSALKRSSYALTSKPLPGIGAMPPTMLTSLLGEALHRVLDEVYLGLDQTAGSGCVLTSYSTLRSVSTTYSTFLPVRSGITSQCQILHFLFHMISYAQFCFLVSLYVEQYIHILLHRPIEI